MSDSDLAGEIDDRTRLRQVFEGLRVRLSERECEAASLCYLQGLSRAGAAARMGISEARMRKLMEGHGPDRPGVASKVSQLLATINAGAWCEQQSSLMRAYAFGILDPDGERHALAVAHCRECPACRARVASLRGLAAILPPLPLPLLLTGGTGAAAGAGAAGTGTGATGAATGAAGAGTTVAKGATGAVVDVGGGAASAGWTGIAGSLAAKLAVTSMVVLGAGYAVLGGFAHGSSPARHAAATPPSIASNALWQALLPARLAPSHGRRSALRSQTPRMRSANGGSAHRAHSTREAVTREFGLEQVRHEGRAAASAQTAPAVSSPRGSSRATRELGFE